MSLRHAAAEAEICLTDKWTAGQMGEAARQSVGVVTFRGNEQEFSHFLFSGGCCPLALLASGQLKLLSLLFPVLNLYTRCIDRNIDEYRERERKREQKIELSDSQHFGVLCK